MATAASSLPDADTLARLAHPVFEMSQVRPAGEAAPYLRERFDQFLDHVGRIRGTLADALAPQLRDMRDLADSLHAAMDLGLRSRQPDLPGPRRDALDARAWQLTEDALDEHAGVLRRISRRHAERVVGSRSWYRLTNWAEASSRADMFHMPFDRRARPTRFAWDGCPALYLANNVYLCWLECQPASERSTPLNLETCRVARFELRLRPGEEFLDLPANHASYLEPLTAKSRLRELAASNPALRHLAASPPGAMMNSPYQDEVIEELAEYLSIWPLLMACTLPRNEPAPADPPEYLLPQLLTRWVLKRKDLVGIRYFTSKSDPATNTNDVSINVVLPVRTLGQPRGFCEFLAERAHCTLPQSFAEVARVPDEELFSKAAADKRQAAAGRYRIRWQGSLQDYQHSPFGRMEYWLDREDLVIAPIEARV